MTRTAASAGIYDHTGWAIVVCIAADTIIDRRRIELIDAGLPAMPFHHACQQLPADEAVALVAQVSDSAAACARRALAGLPPSVRSIAIRRRPALPPTVTERIRSYYAQTRADGVMYRDALDRAARERGWQVHEYEAKSVLDEAARALGPGADIESRLNAFGTALGPPWTRDHRLAAAAAIAALRAGSARRTTGAPRKKKPARTKR